MNEFDFIETYLAPLSGPGSYNLRDDAALITPKPGYELVISMDTMVEGVHFPSGELNARTAGKLLRVNLSDIAAKAAKPVGYFLSIAWPKTATRRDFESFADGLAETQSAFDLFLMGGDTVATEGPMVISVTIYGEVREGRFVTRSGANPGDHIWHSGTIGDAYIGCELVLNHQDEGEFSKSEMQTFQNAYYKPIPRVKLRELLIDFVSASLDISDGLVADAGHLAKASHVGLDIDLVSINLSTAVRAWIDRQADPDQARIKLITAGDDYELLFTAKPAHTDKIQRAANELGVVLSRIGTVTSGDRVVILDPTGNEINIAKPGYRHF